MISDASSSLRPVQNSSKKRRTNALFSSADIFLSFDPPRAGPRGRRIGQVDALGPAAAHGAEARSITDCLHFPQPADSLRNTSSRPLAAVETSRRMRILVPALALAVLVAACGSSPKKAAPTATPSPSGAASSTSAPRTPTPVAAQRNPSPAPRTPTPVAAGGTRAAASATRVTRDDALAQSLLLTTAQLPPPANWSEAPRDTSASPLDRCDPGTFPGETGKADSGDFSRAGE